MKYIVKNVSNSPSNISSSPSLTHQSDTQAITRNATALIPEENHWWQKNKLPLA
jgi:hypothetical protein